MDETIPNQIASLLGEQIGFDARSTGPAAVTRAVQQRLKVLGVQNPDEYWRQASTQTGELQELIEEVVVPETWFFRYPESFTLLTEYVRKEWLHSHPAQVLHVLSAPCSSGEEPYSVAMALLDAGVSAGCFKIDAIDISTRALSLANRAEYSENSFRSENLTIRTRYFSPTAKGYRLADSVREAVTFRHDNLLRPSGLIKSKSYHTIFCRNLLIYLNPPAQSQAIANLSLLLEPGGLLFCGPAEIAIFSRHGFKPIAHREGFALTRTSDIKIRSNISSALPPGQTERRNSTQNQSRIASGIPQKTAPRTITSALEPRPVQLQRVKTKPLPPPEDELKAALRLADVGRLAEAAAICEEHIRQKRDSATAYFVLGLIRDAEDDPRAGAHYRKALYLNPKHSEALMHLTLLLEKQGDVDGAQRLRARTMRLEEQVEH